MSCWKRFSGEYLNLDLWVVQQHTGAWMETAQCGIVKAATGLISCTTSLLSDLHAQSDLYQLMTHLIDQRYELSTSCQSYISWQNDTKDVLTYETGHFYLIFWSVLVSTDALRTRLSLQYHQNLKLRWVLALWRLMIITLPETQNLSWH